MDLPHNEIIFKGHTIVIQYNCNSVHACTCARVQVFVGFSQLQFHLNSYPHLHSPHLYLRVHHHLYHTMYLTVHRPILVPWTYVGLSWTYTCTCTYIGLPCTYIGLPCTYIGLPWTYMYLHRPTMDLRTYIGLPWTYCSQRKTATCTCTPGSLTSD